MIKKFFLTGGALCLMLCHACNMSDTQSPAPVYQSGHFAMYPDRIVQGEFEARAVTDKHIISDYKSPARTNYSSLITFKFSINGKDNEAPSGQDHSIIVKAEHGKYETPVIRFGEKDPANFTTGAPANLSPNTAMRVRLDMREVLSEIKEKGFYTTFSGERVYEIKGVYIAGGSEPLSWDFDNLDKNPEYRLKDEDQDGIYEGTFMLNPHNPDEDQEREWRLKNDISAYPSFRSDYMLIDALYNMSLDETVMNKEEDGTFRTGAKWDGVWTRDISYSVVLSYAFLEPEVSKTSLMKKVKRGRIIQDTGSGGAWPVSTDRVVWSLAAWEIFVATGDKQWLKQAYDIIKNTIEDDLKTIADKSTGLFKGESSFLDWREQTYPAWMDNVDISQSLNLGTNVVFARTFDILARMAALLGHEQAGEAYRQRSEAVKKAINEQLWNADKGYYNQYRYGRHFMNPSTRSESLGEALSVLYGVADARQSNSVIANTPVLPFGTPCIYPQIPGIPPYHNNGIWPFVQAYWNWAAKKVGHERALVHGLASLYRPAALFLTNKENFVAQDGDFLSTQINSDRQLWSVAGNLAMVYRVFLGMELQPDRILLNPFVPEALAGEMAVNGFKYRQAEFDITITGFGNGIAEMRLDGEQTDKYEIPADLKGKHHIAITLNEEFGNLDDKFNLVANKFSLPAPRVQLRGQKLEWQEINGAAEYRIFLDGEVIERTGDQFYNIPKQQFGQFKVLAVDENGVPSFTSEPVSRYSPEDVMTVEIEEFAGATARKLQGHSGKGAVETSKATNQDLRIPLHIDRSGTYLISFRYANGSGPWNTDNKCAIRTLKVDQKKTGTVVMAQRGQDEWSNWGFSNPIEVSLAKGQHLLELTLESNNENMNVEINKALLDYIKLVRIEQGSYKLQATSYKPQARSFRLSGERLIKGRFKCF